MAQPLQHDYPALAPLHIVSADGTDAFEVAPDGGVIFTVWLYVLSVLWYLLAVSIYLSIVFMYSIQTAEDIVKLLSIISSSLMALMLLK